MGTAAARAVGIKAPADRACLGGKALNKSPGKPCSSRRSISFEAILLLVFLAGCSGVPGSVSGAVGDSDSAVATARLVLDQDAAGKLTTAATTIALEDALKEVQSSRDSVLKLSASNQKDRALRQETLKVLDQCAAGFITARDAVSQDNGQRSLAEGQQALTAAADAVNGLKSKVGAK